ncbi:MAG: ABC transporter ATP-binding protein [Candidatus Methylacidiphilales bacterium]|nr:ABC transporter ATP-binding protein [Candidatus Methylacidiphilales bacterium]
MSASNTTTSASSAGPMLDVRNLCIGFASGHDVVPAVHDVSFTVGHNEVVAVVGESGSGKSVTALALTRLLSSPPARYTGGQILFNGKDMLTVRESELRAIRGGQIAYIFQEPGTSLNPVFTIGYQIAEAVHLHRPEVKDVNATVVSALESVGIRNAASRVNDYPHQMSGGMQQRVMIAMALACEPELLVADEPTTALDVTIQKQILDLMVDISKKREMSTLLITHNFGIVAGFAQRIIVMFRGRIVETGPTAQVLSNPQHPYTRALIECVPRLGARQRRLRAIDYAEVEKAMKPVP